MSRAVIAPLLCVLAGLALGIYSTVFLLDVEPAVVGWLLGAGVGISGGAFIAALATNTALAGGSTTARRRIIIEDADEEPELARSPSTNGHSSAHSAEPTVRRPDS